MLLGAPVKPALQRRGAAQRATVVPSFLICTHPTDGLLPSLKQRADIALAWVRRLQRWVPVTAISSELVRFDL
jgi:hypothetical protein